MSITQKDIIMAKKYIIYEEEYEEEKKNDEPGCGSMIVGFIVLSIIVGIYQKSCSSTDSNNTQAETPKQVTQKKDSRLILDSKQTSQITNLDSNNDEQETDEDQTTNLDSEGGEINSNSEQINNSDTKQNN